MLKAITPVIGIVILLLITVSLAASAYSFIFGIAGTAAKTIKTVPYSEDEYKVTIQNLGTEAFNTSEIKIIIDGEEAQLFNPQIIQPQQGAPLEFFPPSIGNNKQIRLSGPSNAVSYTTDLSFFPLTRCEDGSIQNIWKAGGTYKVINDLLINSQACLAPTENNVIIDCDGKMINNIFWFGIWIQANNTIIRNCNIESRFAGILVQSKNNIIENNNINVTLSNEAAIWILNDNIFVNNTLINNDVCIGAGNRINISNSDPQNSNSMGNRCGQDECFNNGSASNICVNNFNPGTGLGDCHLLCI